MLKGNAKTAYMREYMRRRRAGEAKIKPAAKFVGRGSDELTKAKVLIQHLERELPPLVLEAFTFERGAGNPSEIALVAGGAVLLKLLLTATRLCRRVDTVQYGRTSGVGYVLCARRR